jgi:hypothetical protein
LAAAQVAEDVDEGIKRGDWVLGVSPVNLGDGRTLIWPSPQPIAFNLVEAKRFATRGARERRKLMSQLKPRAGDGRYSPPFRRETIDAISDLQSAVLGAFTAIESFANHAIDRLIEVDGEEVEVTRADGEKVRGEALVRNLRLDEKFKLVLPLLDGGKEHRGDLGLGRLPLLEAAPRRVGPRQGTRGQLGPRHPDCLRPADDRRRRRLRGSSGSRH